MTRRLSITTALFALALWLPTVADAQATTTCGSKVSTSARFVVQFEEGEWRATPPPETRITDRDRVDVCIEHFNFLRYTLKFDIAEQRSESYAYLSKLWSSIVSPSLSGVLQDAGAVPADDLLTKLQTLYRLSLETDAAIAAAVRPYTATGLDEAQAQALSAARGSETARPQTGIAGQADIMRRVSQDLQAYLLNPRNAKDFASIYADRYEMYHAITQLYASVNERADIFLRLSAKTIGIEIKRVGKRQPGTSVTFTMVALDEAGGATPVEEVSYFVQSNMPLVVHGGVAVSTLRDVTFEKVRRSVTFGGNQLVGDEELFQERTNEERSTAYTVFLGWQFFGSGADVTANRRQGRLGGAFSLGTDIRQPGRRIFLGPSLMLFNRIVLSAGAVFGKESEGLDETLEPNVFRIIKERPKRKWFFSLSTKVY